MTRRFSKTDGKLNRRQFLARTSAASLLTVPWLIPASARGANGAVAASERINVGLIGIGAMGSGWQAPTQVIWRRL